MAAVSAAASGRIADRFGSGAVAFPGGLLFAAGTLYISLVIGAEPDYLAYLPGMILTGLGVGASFAGFGSAAVAELPPMRYATGSAINATCRQIGAVLGIAVLIALLGDSPGLSDFQQGWAMMVGTGGRSAGFALPCPHGPRRAHPRRHHRPNVRRLRREADDSGDRRET
jgi:NTE family protein